MTKEDLIVTLKNIPPLLIVIVIIFMIVTAVLSGGAVFLWQKVVEEKPRAEFQERDTGVADTTIDQLREAQETIARLEEGKKELEKKACKGVWEDNMCKTPTIKLVAPNGGETLCFGSNFIIQWESSGLKIVRLYAISGEGTRHTIGAFPATFSETGETGKGMVVWKVGELVSGGRQMSEGYTYTVEINSSDARSSNIDKDTSDNIFSIIRCEG